jgi:hypothetical protein
LRDAFAAERSVADVAEPLERLGNQRGLGGGCALGLRALTSYASASPDPAQGALDAALDLWPWGDAWCGRCIKHGRRRPSTRWRRSYDASRRWLEREERVVSGAWLPFAWLLWTAMLRLRFDQSRLVVILSDGAEWIRSMAQWLRIETLLIFALYHAKHRI